jgi:hypothetical protein
MGSAEFSHWLAFLDAEPIGSHGDLQRWAALMAAIANGPLTKRDKSAFRVADFLVDPWQEAPKPKARNPKPGELQAFVAGIKPAKRGRR